MVELLIILNKTCAKTPKCHYTWMFWRPDWIHQWLQIQTCPYSFRPWKCGCMRSCFLPTPVEWIESRAHLKRTWITKKVNTRRKNTNYHSHPYLRVKSFGMWCIPPTHQDNLSFPSVPGLEFLWPWTRDSRLGCVKGYFRLRVVIHVIIHKDYLSILLSILAKATSSVWSLWYKVVFHLFQFGYSEGYCSTCQSFTCWCLLMRGNRSWALPCRLLAAQSRDLWPPDKSYLPRPPSRKNI